jgi:parallel beta-helix repeat protein
MVVGVGTFQALPTITQPLKIDGAGADVTVSGNNGFRVFDINTGLGDDVTLSHLNLTAGNGAAGLGGAVNVNHPDFTLDSSTVSNSSAANGGGIGVVNDSGGTTTIRSSTISGNAATGTHGGGLETYGVPTTIDKSTFSGNTAPGGGGGIYAGGTYGFTLSNTTISGNSSGAGGGVNLALGSAVFQNSTISGNTGGGIEGAYYGAFTLANSIVADNTGPPDVVPDGLFGADGSFSLVESGTITDTIPGSNITGQDPQLGPLQDNGGPTKTQRPARTSPVVDRGKTAGGVIVDQRGLLRPFDVPTLANSTATGADGADMGAVELTLAEASPPAAPAPTTPVKKKKCKKKPKKRSASAAKKCKKKKK